MEMMFYLIVWYFVFSSVFMILVGTLSLIKELSMRRGKIKNFYPTFKEEIKSFSMFVLLSIFFGFLFFPVYTYFCLRGDRYDF